MHISLDSALGRQRRLNSVGETISSIAPLAAAYSLRSLTGGDPRAVRVRRVIDNAESDFTASGISSGALVDFVNQIQTVGTAVNGTGSFDNYTVSNLSTTGFSADNSAGGTGSAGFPYVFKDEDVIVVKYTVTNFSSTASLSPQIRGVNATSSVTGKTNSGTAFTANGTYTDTLTATADGTHLMFADGNTGSYTISDFEIVSHSSSGFVDTWYDQSGNDNHAINDTDDEQPKIVSSGSLIADGIDFDGSDDTLTAASVSGFGATISMFAASVRDSGGAAVVSMGSSASGTTNFGTIEGNSVSNINSRNTTSVTASASVSGTTRLTFGVTTGQTSTKVGALGGTLVESTDDYGDDFTSGELDTIFLGKLRAGSGSSFNGHIKEALIYTTDQSSNRDAIEANIANYYNITLV